MINKECPHYKRKKGCACRGKDKQKEYDFCKMYSKQLRKNRGCDDCKFNK